MVERSLEWLRSEQGRKVVRYLSVSVVSVAVSQAILMIAFGAAGWDAQTANYAAFVVGGAVSYWLNRSWVWGRTSRSDLMREVIPFWIVAIAGLALSTWSVGVAESTAATLNMSHALATLFVMTASLAAFGVGCVGKFVLMNRWVFVPRPTREPA